GVNVRNLRVTLTESLQTALIDETPGPDALDLLEDRAGARMPIEPRVPAPAPTQILLKDAVHRRLIASAQAESRSEHEVAPVMEHRIVVTEVHVVRSDGLALTLFGEDVARLEDLGDEHRALAVGRRREKMEVLPDRAAHGARDPDVMLQAG